MDFAWYSKKIFGLLDSPELSLFKTLLGKVMWLLVLTCLLSVVLSFTPRSKLVKTVFRLDAKGFGGGGFGASSSSSSSSSKTGSSKRSDNEKKRPQIKNLDTSSSSDMKLINDVTKIDEYIGEHIPSVNLNYPGLKALHASPPVFSIDNAFSGEQCASYIDKAPKVGVQTQSQTFSAGSTRTSTTWYLPYNEVEELLKLGEFLTGISSTHFEEPQIVRYEMGQQFSWHYDTIPKAKQTTSGNRLATLLIYLNTLPSDAGGATCFKDLNIQVKPDTGKALLFFPTFKDGSNDERTLHCGQVSFETKYIAQIWIHQNPYESTMRK